VVVFLGLLPIYLLTIHTNPLIMSPDPVGVSGSAWSVARSGTPVLQPGSPAWDVWLIPTGNGAGLVSNREPGLVALGALSYLFAPAAPIRDVTPLSVMAALLSAAAMGVLAAAFHRLVSRRVAIAGAFLAGLGTTTWSVSSTALWPHSPDQLFLALTLLTGCLGTSVGAGVAYALAITVRPPVAAVAPVHGMWHAARARSLRPTLVIGSISAAGLAAVLLYSHIFWRGGLDSQYVDAGSGFTSSFVDVRPQAWLGFLRNIALTVVSPSRGVLSGSMFLLLLVPGLAAAWRVAPPWVRSATVGGLVYLAIQLKANRYDGGYQFWSYRYPLETLTLAAPLLVLAWKEWTSKTVRRRAYFLVLSVLSVTVQALGAVSYPALRMGLGRPNPWLPGDHPAFAVAILGAGAVAAFIVFVRVVSRGDTDSTRERSS
jgi:hypothetical protein